MGETMPQLLPIVCKFDGAATASADQLRKVRDIIASDPRRQYVVVSAFGKRVNADYNCTSLLMLCDAHARLGYRFDSYFQPIAERFRSMVSRLQLDLDIQRYLDEVEAGIITQAETNRCYAASRGEYLMAMVVADHLRRPFLDAVDVVCFDAEGRLDADRTHAALARRLSEIRSAVIPGFYGAMPDGRIQTFPRGGSDITAALVVKAAGAGCCECWTDAPGLAVAAASVEPRPRPHCEITLGDLLLLPDAGAKVFHPLATVVAQQAGIAVNIRDLEQPANAGLWVAPDEPLAGRQFP